MDALQNSPGAAAGVTPVQANALSLPPVMPGGGAIPIPKKCKCGVCPTCIQRAKWRDKYHKRKGNAVGEFLPPLPSPASAVSPAPSENAALPVVPHNPADWEPVVKTIVEVGEKVSVSTLQKLADKIGDKQLCEEVKEGAPFPIGAKETLFRTGPPIAAKLAEKIGLPAEAANGAMFVGALGQIALHHFALQNRLAQSVARIEEAKGIKPKP